MWLEHSMPQRVKDFGSLVCLWGFRTRKPHDTWSQFLKLSRHRAGCQHGSQGQGVASEELGSESIKQQGYLLTTLDSIKKEKKIIHHENEILSVTPIGLPTN